VLTQHEDIYKTLLELSFEVSEVIINTTDRVAMYKKILDRICDRLGFDYAEIWEMSKDERLVKTNIMTVRNSSMEGFADVSQNYSFLFGKGIPGITWKVRQPQWIDNVQEEHTFLRRVEAKTHANFRIRLSGCRLLFLQQEEIGTSADIPGSVELLRTNYRDQYHQGRTQSRGKKCSPEE